MVSYSNLKVTFIIFTYYFIFIVFRTTSRLDLVQLISLEHNNDQDCSSRVVVSTISKERIRNTAIVLAEDIYTGQVLRCDVILDVISTLNIVTTTRELFMEEAPEAFEVRASDDQGNILMNHCILFFIFLFFR